MIKQRALRVLMAATLAIATAATAMGSIGSRQGDIGAAFPPRIAPGQVPPWVQPAWVRLTDIQRGESAWGGYPSPGIDIPRRLSSSISVAAIEADAGDGQATDGILAELGALTGLPAATLESLCSRVGDWRYVVRRAPIYRSISDLMASLGSDAQPVIRAVGSGADPSEILSVLQWLQTETIPVTELEGIRAAKSSSMAWSEVLEPILAKYGKAEADPLSKDEIRDYLAGGLSPDDILESLGLGRTVSIPVRSLLAERLAGRTWDELAAAYDPEGLWQARKTAGWDDETKRLVDLGYELADVRMAQVYARAMGLNAEEVLRRALSGTPVQQQALDKAAAVVRSQTDRLLQDLRTSYGLTEAAIQHWQDLGLSAREIENVARLAQAKGISPDLIAGMRLDGQSWEAILEQLAPEGVGDQ